MTRRWLMDLCLVANIAIASSYSLAFADAQPAPGQVQQPVPKEPVAPETQPGLINVPDGPAADAELPAIFAAPQTPRFYAEADYLFWWVKSAPLPIPIVTQSPLISEAEGLIPGVTKTILYGAPWPNGVGGSSQQDFPAFSGTRLTLGGWLDNARVFGVEASGFLLQSQSVGFSAASDATGAPRLNLVALNAVTYSAGNASVTAGTEDGVPISVYQAIAGSITITNSLRLWGTGITGVFNLYRSSSWELNGVAGFRYLDLYEAFDLSASLMGFGNNSLDTTHGVVNFAGESGTLADHFQTRNQFYGGTLGLKGRYTLGRWSIDASARVSLGASLDVLNVNGGYHDVNFPNSGQSSSGSEGFYAQPSNEGRTAQNKFAVAPEGQIKVGYALTSWMRFSAGYDLLYMTNVVRPVDQINRNLPVGQSFNQSNMVSSIYPMKEFNLTDFFANGLSFSLELRY
jgi:hypothetical protein